MNLQEASQQGGIGSLLIMGNTGIVRFETGQDGNTLRSRLSSLQPYPHDVARCASLAVPQLPCEQGGWLAGFGWNRVTVSCQEVA